MIFQHGTYNITDGVISFVPFLSPFPPFFLTCSVTEPFADDGLIQIQSPCAAVSNMIQRFASPGKIDTYWQYYDKFLGKSVLQMIDYSGALPPLYLVYQPPQMLPTRQLRPSSPATKLTKATMTAF